jgi:hypothetical protein
MLPKSFFRKTRFLSEFFYKSAPHKLSGPNGLYGAIGGKIVLVWSFVSLKKHVYGPNFFTKPSPHLFLGPNGLFGVFGGKTISHENFASFGLVSHRNLFSKKDVFCLNFFTKPCPLLFLRPNGLFGEFGGKIISHENVTSFGLVSHRNLFSKKHVFCLYFYRKAHRTNSRGQTDYMARLGAKLFRSEVLYLWKNPFMVRIFLLNRPLTNFRGQTDCLVCLEAKLFRTKTSLHLAS